MAKTTGKIKGNIRMLYMDGNMVGCSTSNGLTLNNETVEDSCKDGSETPPRTYQAGVQEWSFSATVVVKFDDANQYSKLAAAAIAQTEHEWTFGDENSDNPYWEGPGIISAFTENAEQNSPLTVDITISPRGSLHLFNT